MDGKTEQAGRETERDILTQLLFLLQDLLSLQPFTHLQYRWYSYWSDMSVCACVCMRARAYVWLRSCRLVAGMSRYCGCRWSKDVKQCNIWAGIENRGVRGCMWVGMCVGEREAAWVCITVVYLYIRVTCHALNNPLYPTDTHSQQSGWLSERPGPLCYDLIRMIIDDKWTHSRTCTHTHAHTQANWLHLVKNNHSL